MNQDEYAQMMAKTMAEKDLQMKVESLARSLGWLAYHVHDSRRSEPGFPDLVLAKAGRPMLFRELKRQREKPTPDQVKWMETMRAAGADVGVWRPVQWFDRTIEKELTA